MVLILLPPPMSRESGRGVFQQSLSCAFSIPRGPRDGVPSRMKDLLGLAWSPCWPSHGCVYASQGCSERSVLGWRVRSRWDGAGGESDFHINLA